MKDSKFNLPTPQMLIGRAKETTIPVSLRVKQSTVDIFDKMAAAAGVNRGTMMNTLLDFYAQNQPTSENNAKETMLNYLKSERFWRLLPKLSSEELIFKIVNMGVELPELDSATSLLEAYNTKDKDSLLALIDTNDNSDRFVDTIAVSDTIGCRKGRDYTELYVTLEQWPLVVVLLSEYNQKHLKLFPDQEFAMTPATFEKIAEACESNVKNSYSNMNLALDIKNILLDFVETQND